MCDVKVFDSTTLFSIISVPPVWAHAGWSAAPRSGYGAAAAGGGVAASRAGQEAHAARGGAVSQGNAAQCRAQEPQEGAE